MNAYRFDQGNQGPTYFPRGWATPVGNNPFPIVPSWRFYTETADEFKALLCGALPSEL